ncbi:MAG: class I SAM-dependent methyltransferase [Calditrichaeota bacterium]|nr:MAG: class I SAM-dependent methyltransferase [Calditrichota bacterium]
MDNLTLNIKQRYNRISAIYDLMEKPMEVFAAKWRVDITSEVYGKVLEVGVGTGKNIPFYPPNIELTAIDFSPKMLQKARTKYEKTHPNVRFLEMDVQHLEFEDNSFDCVLTSCVFCSVPAPVEGLKEIRRVCKPGGKIVMLEHVRSKNKWLGLLMDVLNPIPLYLYGANINRDTVENLKKAGFENIFVEDLWLDIFKKIIVVNIK